MNVNCPSCHRFYHEDNFSPGGVRKCPHCGQILYLPMELVPECYLVPLEGENVGERLPLTEHMVIGRSRDCEIYVPDQTLSRQHASLIFERGHFVLKDLGSRNGMLVNEVQVSDAKLQHLDVIRMGARTWRFEDGSRPVAIACIDSNAAVGPSADEHMGTIDVPGQEATVFGQLHAHDLDQHGASSPHVPRAVAKPKVLNPPSRQPDLPPPPAPAPPALVPIPDDEPPPIPLPPPRVSARPTLVPLPDSGPIPVPAPKLTPPAPPPEPKLEAKPEPKLEAKPEPKPAPKPEAKAPPPPPVPQVEQTIRYELGNRNANLAEVVYLCAEVRGFAQIAEVLEPVDVVMLINQYLAFLVGIMRRHGATVDRFTGDSIRAFWGAPESRPDDALRAVKCALQMQSDLPQFNRLASPSGTHRVELAIALHAGEAVAGSVGWEQRFEFTVVGEVVVVATKLQELTRAGQVLITSSIHRQIKDQVETYLLSPVDLRGRGGQIPVFLVQSVKK